MLKNKLIIILAIILTVGCKDEFLLDTKNYKPILVVEGMITNEPGPYTIKLSESSPINNYAENPLQNFNVVIYDSDDNSETLTETEPGIYTTDENGIKGEIGKSYKISITTPDGQEYGSEFEEMKSPVGIDKVESELSLKKTQDFPEGLPGYQFYVSTELAPEKDTYFLWNLVETYEYSVDFELWDIYFGELKLDTNKRIRDTIVNRYVNTLSTCWNTQKVNYVFTGKTSNLITPEITKQPLLFIGTDTKKLQHRYSLLVRQVTVNADAYYFWKNVEDQSKNENFLTLNQPYNIKGNVKNLDNPDEIISGYFTVGSVIEKRIFVDNPNAPFFYDKCTMVTDPGTIKYLFERGNPPFYLIEYDNSYGFGILVYEYCVNCVLSGGENTEPDFWIYF